MAWTQHGHQILGTPVTEPEPHWASKMRCGGPKICKSCREESITILGTEMFETENATERLDLIVGEPTDYVAIAKGIAVEYIMGRELAKPSIHTVYMESFTKVLDGWKGRFGTTLPDGMMYELTCNVAKGVVYVDAYQKVDQEVVKL